MLDYDSISDHVYLGKLTGSLQQTTHVAEDIDLVIEKDRQDSSVSGYDW